jgi:hypothetical protein
MAQQKPDFSGEWILDRQASTLGPGADAMQSGVWRIDHREPTFHHRAVFSAGSASREYEYELVADGPEVVSEEGQVRTASSLNWEGDGLVVTFRTRHPGGEVTVTFRYELIDEQRRLRAIEQVRGTDHDQDNVWIFKRR